MDGGEEGEGGERGEEGEEILAGSQAGQPKIVQEVLADLKNFTEPNRRIITIKTKCQLPKRLKASPYPAKPRRSKYTVNQITCQTIIVQTQEVLWILNLGLWILYY